MADYYPKSRTDHIAKVMKLDPIREEMASKIYAERYSDCHCREDHDINPPCGSVVWARKKVDEILAIAEKNGMLKS
jgi:hypothetical protein